MYEWGTKPTQEMLDKAIATPIVLGQGYKFQKGEHGQIMSFEWKTKEVCREDRIPTEQQFADTFKTEMKNKGANVWYLRVTKTQKFAYFGGAEHTWAFWYVSINIEECWFTGDIFIADDMLVLIIAILVVGAITVYCIYEFAPIVFHWAGVSPAEVFEYKASDWVFFIIIGAIILLAIGIVYAGWFRKKK